MTKRLDRHDTILMARRRRQRAVTARPKIWLRLGQFLLGLLILVGVIAATVTGVVAATVFGVYNEYAAQLPDVSAIEQQQDQFQTVRLYDRCLLYTSRCV